MGVGVRDTPAGRAPDHGHGGWRGTTLVVLIALAALTAGSLPLPATWQQVWAATWYPVVQTRLAPATGLLPVAALDLVIGGLALGLAAALWQIRRGVLRWPSAVARAACGAATAWLAFQLLWGWHYQTPTLEYRLLTSASAPSADGQHGRADRARAVTAHAVDRLNALHAEAHARPWPSGAAARRAIAPVLRGVLRDLHVQWHPVFPAPRRSIADRYFRWAGIDGMTNPFGLEVILNSRLLEIERTHVLAHEWAHVAGFADESDASFVAWMTGVRAGGQLEYAAWLAVVPHLWGALSAADRQARRGSLGEGPITDLRAIAARAAERSPAVQELAWRVYDRFLKANRVTEGVARYDAVTRLILSAADERTGRLRESVSWSAPAGRGRGH